MSTVQSWINGHVDYDAETCLPWPFVRDRHGYGYLTFEGRTIGAHRLMCIKAHGPAPFVGAQAAHSCGRGVDGCVNPRHLRWASRSENEMDRVEHGTSNRGERNRSNRISERDVPGVYQRIKAGESHQSISAEFGVCRETITAIAMGRSWWWLTGVPARRPARRSRKMVA